MNDTFNVNINIISKLEGQNYGLFWFMIISYFHWRGEMNNEK